MQTIQTQIDVLQKIKNRQAVVAVIGLGYVGLPLAIAFAEAGFRVVGIDINQGRVDILNRGESFISDVSEETIKRLITAQKLLATTNYDVLNEADAAIICVPTPLGKTKDPDLSFVVASAKAYR